MSDPENQLTKLVDQYLEQLDWQVNENSNMAYSLQGMNNYISGQIINNYWQKKIYTHQISKAHDNRDLHIHDMDVLGSYCVGWSLQDFLLDGFTGVRGKTQSKPAKHFRTALGQLVNLFYTLQGESAGAQAVSNFDTLLAPFIYYDKLTYDEVKQAMQEFVFNMNVPTRVGFQTPFTNLTMDLTPSPILKDETVIIGGKRMDKTYKEFQKEMDMVNQAFCEVMIEGDASGRIFSFPIPTYNVTKDFDWNNPNMEYLWKMTAKYGIPYFSNFVNSDLNPEDARSMCCRLRLDTKKLAMRGGGMFGSNPLTGSVGVVTLNMPRIGYLAKNEKDFYARVAELMDLAKESLEIKRDVVEEFTDKGLYPYTKFYLRSIKQRFGRYWENHFSTIGLLGMNEAIQNLFGKDVTIATAKGQKFAEEVLVFMRDRLVEYQEETGNHYNLEATPGEGTTYRFAKKDKELYPEIICANEDEYQQGAEPFYTNSTQLPVNYTHDIFEALDLQDEIQTKYTGGTVIHIFAGEKVENTEVIKDLVKKICYNYKLPYFTFTPTFSVCPSHGYMAGEHFECTTCGAHSEVYSRVVGYIRPVQQWNKGKKEEFKHRKSFNQVHYKKKVTNKAAQA